LVGITAEELRIHVEALGDAMMLGRDTPGPGGDLAARYVANAFAALGLQPADEAGAGPEAYFQSFAVGELEVKNVVGVLWGDDPSTGAIVVGAHYDGVGSRHGGFMPAADDNASGTAMVIAAAAALARSAAASGPLEHSLVFVAFGSEEDGLLGARHYCEHPLVPLSATRAMINLDTIGRPRAETLQIVGWSRYRELSSLLQRAAGAEGVDAVAGPRSLWRRSDQAAFADAGVPSVWLLGHLRDDIHSRDDTPDRLDYEWMARVTRALAASIHTGFRDNGRRQ
jgi:Zn-dependent M28 family amino/carboxypeptidase